MRVLICYAERHRSFLGKLYKLIYTVVAEEISQYGEVDHVSSLSPEAATETQNMR